MGVGYRRDHAGAWRFNNHLDGGQRMTDYAAVLSRRHRNRQWTMNADDYDQLVMLDGGDKPSKKSLDDAWASVQAEIEAERQAKLDARVSALAKLSALGLTDEEIAALVR